MSPEGPIEESAVLGQIRAGENRDLQLLVAKGFMPLPPGELLPALILLVESDDAELAGSAEETLAELDPKIVRTVVEEGLAPEVLRGLAVRSDHPMIVESIIRYRRVPRDVLVEFAARLAPDMQEVLLLRQDAIVEVPDILDSLESNPKISTYSARRIREYRQHLLPRIAGSKEERVAADEAELDAEEVTEEEVAAAIEEVLETVEASGEVDEDSGLSEIQVRALPIPVRLKLSRGASRGLRNILIKDSNPLVALSVLNNNAMSDSELEHIASNRAVTDDVLEAIGRTRQFSRKYSVVHALVRNPRTPVGLATRLVPRLGVRDLRNLAKDRNVADAVRSMGARLYKMKRS